MAANRLTKALAEPPAPRTISDVVNELVGGKIDASIAVSQLHELVEREVYERTATADMDPASHSYPAWFYSEQHPAGVLIDNEAGMEKLPPGDWFMNPSHVGNAQDHAHFEVT